MTATEEFFEHCGNVDNHVFTPIDGYDYIDISQNGNEVTITISDEPIHGTGTYSITDINTKDITINEALENIKLKYKDKDINIINLRK